MPRVSLIHVQPSVLFLHAWENVQWDSSNAVCLQALWKKEETPKSVIRPKQIPQATCQYSHLQHKSSKACFRGFIVHLFVLNKTGGGILKKIYQKYTWESAKIRVSVCSMQLNNKKADYTHKKIIISITWRNLSTPSWQDVNNCSAGEEMGKIMEEKAFLGNASGWYVGPAALLGVREEVTRMRPRGLGGEPPTATPRSPLQGQVTSTRASTDGRAIKDKPSPESQVWVNSMTEILEIFLGKTPSFPRSRSESERAQGKKNTIIYCFLLWNLDFDYNALIFLVKKI